MVLKLKVPYAFKVREPVRVPWLVMCATLCYHNDLLGAYQTVNQRVERYAAEHDEGTFTAFAPSVGVMLLPRPEWLGARPEAQARGSRKD